jgi:hypothetical protein
MASLRYQVGHEDPYAQIARRETEIGRRMPLPYQAASALAASPVAPELRYPVPAYEDAHGAQALFSSGSVSGRRETLEGLVGKEGGLDTWDTRQKFGYGRLQSRSGYSEEWDNAANRERRSGKLFNIETQTQAVDPRWPYLYLRATGAVAAAGVNYVGNAQVLLTAGMYDTGGAEAQREFWLGGGFTGSFDFQGWDQVTIDVLSILSGTRVEFAWVTNGVQAGDRSLYLPGTFAAAVSQPVPEGAYQIVVEDPGAPVTLSWFTAAGVTISQVVGSVPGVNYLLFGQQIPVLGTSLAISVACDMVWIERPI